MVLDMVGRCSLVSFFLVLGSARRVPAMNSMRCSHDFMRPITSVRHRSGPEEAVGRRLTCARCSTRPHTTRRRASHQESTATFNRSMHLRAEHREDGGGNSRASWTVTGAMLTLVSFPGFASANIPHDAAGTTAAAAVSSWGGVVPLAVATGEMGARLDAPAAISFGAVVLAFAFLQVRIRNAIKARKARREYEEVLRSTEKRQLAGEADDEEVRQVAERMSQLTREELETRTVEIFGVPFNLVLPDGGSDGRGGGVRSAARRDGRQASGRGEGLGASRRSELGIRDLIKQTTEADLREGKAREEEMSVSATLKVAALWLVLISQLWLLAVLSNDPMGSLGSTLLRDGGQ